MSFLNNRHRGDLTIQAHTALDVFAQLPVGDRGTEQLDEYEMDFVPAPVIDLDSVHVDDRSAFIAWYEARTGLPLVPAGATNEELDAAFQVAYVAEMSAAYYRMHYPDHDLSRGAHLVTAPPRFLPLNLDVSIIKRLRATYHDLAGRNDVEYFDDPAEIATAQHIKHANGPADKAYRVMLLVEFEETI